MGVSIPRIGVSVVEVITFIPLSVHDGQIVLFDGGLGNSLAIQYVSFIG